MHVFEYEKRLPEREVVRIKSNVLGFGLPWSGHEQTLLGVDHQRGAHFAGERHCRPLKAQPHSLAFEKVMSELAPQSASLLRNLEQRAPKAALQGERQPVSL